MQKDSRGLCAIQSSERWHVRLFNVTLTIKTHQYLADLVFTLALCVQWKPPRLRSDVPMVLWKKPLAQGRRFQPKPASTTSSLHPLIKSALTPERTQRRTLVRTGKKECKDFNCSVANKPCLLITANVPACEVFLWNTAFRVYPPLPTSHAVRSTRPPPTGLTTQRRGCQCF